MDVETLLLVVAAVVGTITAVAHLLGYVPPRYKRVLGDVQAETATRIHDAVKSALNEAASEQMALAEKAQKEFEEQVKKHPAPGMTDEERSTAMSMVRAVRTGKDEQAAVTALLARGALEQYLPVLRMVLPGVADQLEENPELIFSLIENPFFKRHILPRIQAYLPSSPGGETGAGQFPSTGSGWGP